MTQPPGGGPTVRRVQLGARLRVLREAAGVTRANAGWAIRGSESKISRMELGRVSFKTRDVVDLLSLYGLKDEEERSRLVALAEEANTPGWWQAYTDILPDWFQNYLDLEGAAEQIRTYEVQFVPGLLQTESYARAVIELGRNHGPGEIGRRAELRAARRQILDRPDAPLLWVVLDEAVLRRPIGNERILRDQIRSLREIAGHDRVRLQILPFTAGGHSGTGGAFSVLRFPHPDLPDVVYLEHLTSAVYLERPSDVDAYSGAFGELIIQAAQPDDSAELLGKILDDLS
ncbi:helix-turn-helix domain-containing protein [Paractinoplanes rishiriensis]|uniref:Transcriptional regulator n=1 Tax=Paractinoplanes rishiriensis TaxID=1050105 RepID=A0A919K099_9ACTN|nr:helix-turn-helix transcriptional regulator [Actinoplanes rishiriensis]GIE98521.1 transcriptional regulator [Actinoplanes rishiriensis]